MAKVILGGQLLSLLLSLLVTPVAYSLWDDLAKRTKRIAGWFARRSRRPEPAADVAKETVLRRAGGVGARFRAATGRTAITRPHGVVPKSPTPR